ncbi:MAG: protein kinase [Actinomycetota bacterium]|nr:protein kinase [Actinomycetota bacterium]
MLTEMFGPYRIDGLLGRGGMGEVYRAYDESQKRIVALKVLSPHLAGDESFRTRFRRESELAARLREPHVIPIHRYGEIEGRLFIDMRLVEGSDLATVLAKQGGLPPTRAVAIISQLAQALDAAHADRLIHRDVKPSNVLLTRRHEEVTEDGDQQGFDDEDVQDFVYLVDFGIARATEDVQGLTRTGAALGSLDYMAPERFLEGIVDRRTDVYSLACLLYECLAGRPPFPGPGLPQLMHGHLNEPPPQPSAAVSGLPTAMDAVVARGMAKLPDERFARAGDLALAARRAMRSTPRSGPIPAVVDPVRSATTKLFTSNRGASVARPQDGLGPDPDGPQSGPHRNAGDPPAATGLITGLPPHPDTGRPNHPDAGPPPSSRESGPEQGPAARLSAGGQAGGKSGPPSSQLRNRRRLILAGAVAALVAAVAIVAVWLGSGVDIDPGSGGESNFADSRDVAVTFIEALANGDSDAAYDLLCPDAQAGGDDDAFPNGYALANFFFNEIIGGNEITGGEVTGHEATDYEADIVTFDLDTDVGNVAVGLELYQDADQGLEVCGYYTP